MLSRYAVLGGSCSGKSSSSVLAANALSRRALQTVLGVPRTAETLQRIKSSLGCRSREPGLHGFLCHGYFQAKPAALEALSAARSRLRGSGSLCL